MKLVTSNIQTGHYTSGNPECLAKGGVSAAVTNVLPDMVCQDFLRVVLVNLVLEGLLSKHEVTPLPWPPYVVQSKIACEQSSGLDAKLVCLLAIRPVCTTPHKARKTRSKDVLMSMYARCLAGTNSSPGSTKRVDVCGGSINQNWYGRDRTSLGCICAWYCSKQYRLPKLKQQLITSRD